MPLPEDVLEKLQTDTPSMLSFAGLSFGGSRPNFKPVDFVELFGAMGPKTNLRELEVIRMDLKAEDLQALAEALERGAVLENLNFSRCSIDAEGAGVLAGILAADKSALVSLNLQQNKIGDTGMLALVEALAKNTSLLELDVADNENIGRRGKNALKELLERDNFTLCNNVYSTKERTVGASLLIKAPVIPKGMESHVIRKGMGSHIADDRDYTVQVQRLLYRNHLIRLAIRYAEVKLQQIEAARGTGGARVSASEADNKAQFDQDMETLTSVTEKLHAALESTGKSNSPNAQKVRVMLETAMADCFSQKLEISSREIYFSNSNLDSDAIVGIAANLAQNTKWEKLYLRNNPFGPKGVAALADAAEKNTTLVELEIGELYESDDTRRLFAAIQRNRDVQAVLDYAAKTLDADATPAAVDEDDNEASAARTSTAKPEEAIRKLYAAFASINDIESPSAEITRGKLIECVAQSRRLQAGESAPAGVAALMGGAQAKTQPDVADKVEETPRPGTRK